MGLIKVLEKTVSLDRFVSRAIKAVLKKDADAGLIIFLEKLLTIMCDPQNSPVSRMAAAIQLKKRITSSKGAEIRLQPEWEKLSEKMQQNILDVLETENLSQSSLPSSANPPLGQWNNLMQTLVNKVVSERSTEMEREATLETIGYICQYVNAEVLEAQSEAIVTAYVRRMRMPEPSNHVRLAATNKVFTLVKFVDNQELKSSLCVSLQLALRQARRETKGAPAGSDAIMNGLLTMFNSSSGKAGSVQEDALMAVSNLVELLGEGFVRHMKAFQPVLLKTLENYQDYQICAVAISLVGDIARGIKIAFIPYCYEIMTKLKQILETQDIHRGVKPQVLSVFGDISLSIGAEFKEKYLDSVLTVLAQVMQIQLKEKDVKTSRDLRSLRESVLKAFTGIVYALNVTSPDIHLLQNHVPLIIQTIKEVMQDPKLSETTMSSCAGLIGDLCLAFRAPLLPFIMEDNIVIEMLIEGKKSMTPLTRFACNWAFCEIATLKQDG